MTELHPTGEAKSQVRKELTPLDLSDGYVLDGESMRHASVLARALLDRMEALLDRTPNPRQPHPQNAAAVQQTVSQHQESSRER
jgi:hypothetical protein